MGTKLFAFRIPLEKLKKGELIDYDFYSDISKFSLLEDGRVLFSEEPNNPYDVTPSPGFLQRQAKEQLDSNIKTQHEQIARETKAEKVRVLAIQRVREKSEAEARVEIDNEKSGKSQAESQQKEIDEAYAAKKLELKKQNQESHSSVAADAATPPQNE